MKDLTTKVILDCDCTIGYEHHDVDDGLALAHLLRTPSIELLGVTLTDGNADIRRVVKQSRQLWQELDLDTTMVAGGGFDHADDSPAVHYLVETVKRLPNEVVVVATGSQTNIAAAAAIDDTFLDHLAGFYVMGGDFDGQMQINGVNVDELNFSVNHSAALQVLTKALNPVIVSGTYISNIVTSYQIEPRNWIDRAILDWQTYNHEIWQIDGFVNWDGITTTCLTNPSLFNWQSIQMNLSSQTMKRGIIEPGKDDDPKATVMTGVNDLEQLQASLLEDIRYLSQLAD